MFAMHMILSDSWRTFDEHVETLTSPTKYKMDSYKIKEVNKPWIFLDSRTSEIYKNI